MTDAGRRRFLKYLAACGLGLPLAAGGYMFAIEPAWLEVTQTDIFLPGLPPAFDGFRIAHVSDIHYGSYLPLARLDRVVRMVNALAADLITFTGDYVSEPVNLTYLRERALGRPTPDFRRSANAETMFGVCMPRIAQMQARLGRVAVLGNHDHWMDATVGRRWLAESGIPLLENRHLTLEQDGDHLVLAGVDDLWEGRQDLAAALAGAPAPEAAPRILLSHNPDYAVDPAVAAHGIDLMLSGHTHGGQITLPGFGPPILPIRHRQFARGLVRTGWGQVYVSRGVGQITPPVRFLTRPEIALLRLRRPA